MSIAVAGQTAAERLCQDIQLCLQVWGDDPAYADAAFKLRQVERELDVICASPGRREALRLGTPDAGQVRRESGDARGSG